MSVHNIMDYFTEKLSNKYPDTSLVTDIARDIYVNHNRTCHSSLSDGKWR